jgi:hypothetical protein
MWPQTRRRPLDARVRRLNAQEDAALRLWDLAQEHGKSLANGSILREVFFRLGQRRTGVEVPPVEVDRVISWPVVLHGL